MIQANELRVGNWVQRPEDLRSKILDGENIYFYVDAIMIRDCLHYKDNWAFEPIPLTHEILEKCGFKTVGKQKNIKSFQLNVSASARLWLVVRKEYINLSITPLYGNSGAAAFKHIKSLHQLQNLYFALTGTELNYTP